MHSSHPFTHRPKIYKSIPRFLAFFHIYLALSVVYTLLQIVLKVVTMYPIYDPIVDLFHISFIRIPLHSIRFCVVLRPAGSQRNFLRFYVIKHYCGQLPSSPRHALTLLQIVLKVFTMYPIYDPIVDRFHISFIRVPLHSIRFCVVVATRRVAEEFLAILRH